MSLATVGSGVAVIAKCHRRQRVPSSRHIVTAGRKHKTIVAAVADNVREGEASTLSDSADDAAAVAVGGFSMIAEKTASRRQAMGAALVAAISVGVGGGSSAAFADEADAASSAVAPPIPTSEDAPAPAAPAPPKPVPAVRYKGTNWSVVVRMTMTTKTKTTTYPTRSQT